MIWISSEQWLTGSKKEAYQPRWLRLARPFQGGAALSVHTRSTHSTKGKVTVRTPQTLNVAEESAWSKAKRLRSQSGSEADAFCTLLKLRDVVADRSPNHVIDGLWSKARTRGAVVS